MKKSILFLSFLLSCFIFVGCDVYDNQSVASPTSNDQLALQDTNFVAALKSNVSPLKILATQLSDSLAIITVSAVPTKLDAAATISYVLQIDTAKTFATNKIVPSKFNGKATSDVKVGYQSLNDSILAFNKTSAQRTIYARYMAYISNGGLLTVRKSAVMTISATPLAALSPLFITGSILGSHSWDPTNYSYIMFRDDASVTNPVYTYTTNFNVGEFKMLVELNNWATAWCLNSVTGKIEQKNNGDNLKVTTAGYQTMTFNMTTGVLSFTTYDVSTAANYISIGLVGAFSGWSASGDILLSQSDYDPHIWEGFNVTLPTGELKFRADMDWTHNWGSSTFPYGKATAGGSNINVSTAGTYYVKFNDLTGHYVFYKVS